MAELVAGEMYGFGQEHILRRNYCKNNCLSAEHVGKRIRLKVEVIDDEVIEGVLRRCRKKASLDI